MRWCATPETVQGGNLGELDASRFYEDLGERGKHVFTVYREVAIVGLRARLRKTLEDED